ncbi:hypothetical protein GGR56DRAFT_390973 [Xylariaceae sp. FL0804]|nr:hypothetical protein GGR56DRAFT_390973 [Xylariaceae sp. FL0804]
MAATAAMAAPADKVSPNGKLDTAMTDFATSFVKQELLQLARERDDNLARNQVPRLRALLREVDRERDAFASDKDRIIRGLRDKLQLLQMDDHSVDHIVAELLCMSPKYLDVIPSTSTLSIRPPTPTTSPVRDSNNYFSTVLGADASPLNGNPGSSIPPAAQAATPELTSPQSLPQSLPLRDGPGSPSGPISPRAPVSLSVPVSPRGFSSHVSQTLGEVIAENLKDTKTPKRSRSVGRATRTPLKRLKTDPIKKRVSSTERHDWSLFTSP